MAAKDDYLLSDLIDLGFLTKQQVDAAQVEADAAAEGVIDTLLKKRLIRVADVTTAKAAHFGVEMISLAEMRIADDVLSAVPRHIAKRYKVVPVYIHDHSVVIALSDPSDLSTLDSLHHVLHKEIEMRVASEDEIDAALAKFYGGDDESVASMIQNITEGEVEVGTMTAAAADDTEAVDADAPIIKLVNGIIIEAYRGRASDIHLEPLAKTFRVRYRIDGFLQEQKGPPKRLQASITSRLKIQSNMSIAEKRIPQDGRIQCNVGGKTIDLRVSCIPTTHGESIVMRILDKESLRLGLTELGFFTDDQQTFERLIGLPDGIILVTGPTGSGKTTTLYSCLNFINRPDRKIITVEDPVEYVLAGINQVQVSESVGLTFSTALRAMLRQAPNVIMLGEIRDMETASIAINASLTGHLVFSTLHTNDAPGAVTRLIDIGVKPFLVASSTRAMMAQRLVRKICKKCGAAYVPTEKELSSLGIDMAKVEKANFRKGKGCPDCNNTGNRGRMGIFEVYVLNDESRRLINEKAPASELRRQAREMGMRSLREDGARKVVAGVTTPDEVIKATTADAE
ncbi:MAG TPA: type II secretion system protein E [Verrucomicrobiales bacterium]|nr:type II secretion system protein E [Verrucomicrobiales bacterium]